MAPHRYTAASVIDTASKYKLLWKLPLEDADIIKGGAGLGLPRGSGCLGPALRSPPGGFELWPGWLPVSICFSAFGALLSQPVQGGWHAGSVCPPQKHTRTCPRRPPSDRAGTSPRLGWRGGCRHTRRQPVTAAPASYWTVTCCSGPQFCSLGAETHSSQSKQKAGWKDPVVWG